MRSSRATPPKVSEAFVIRRKRRLPFARPSSSEGLDTEVALVNSALDELLASKDKKFNVVLVDPGRSSSSGQGSFGAAAQVLAVLALSAALVNLTRDDWNGARRRRP